MKYSQICPYVCLFCKHPLKREGFTLPSSNEVMFYCKGCESNGDDLISFWYRAGSGKPTYCVMSVGEYHVRINYEVAYTKIDYYDRVGRFGQSIANLNQAVDFDFTNKDAVIQKLKLLLAFQ